MIKKTLNKIWQIWHKLVIDKQTLRYIRHNMKVWSAWDVHKSERTILADLFPVNQTNIAYAYFLNVLAKKHGAIIRSYGPRERLNNRVLHRVYRSFNVKSHITTTLNDDQKQRLKILVRETLPKLKTKNAIFDLNIFGVWIGIDIYESYLRKYNKPTIYLEDPKLLELIEQGLGLVIFWEDFFAQNKVSAVIASHDCYLTYDVVCKIAYKNKIPVYFPNSIYINRAEKPHSTHAYFYNYRQMFKKLSGEEQKNAIVWAKNQLNRRFNGEIGVDMPYATKSAFCLNADKKPVLIKSENVKVLICSQCFFDNPHGWGGTLFLDFYEWLNFLGKISERTNYDWYLKVHPDPLPGTLEIMQSILQLYPKIKMIPHETSFHQLAKEGLDFVLTVYGSVGGECPLLGIQVINAGHNPRIAYDFNWHSKSLEEYEHYLLNLDKLHKEVKAEDVYEFYYMHHNYVYDDDLIFKSYKQFLLDIAPDEYLSSRVYAYFLDQLTTAKHREIINNMQKYIDSGNKYYFSHGPE